MANDTVTPFRTKKIKVSLESAVQRVLEEKPDEILVVGMKGDEITIFSSSLTNERMMWLLEMGKFALLLKD